MPQMKFVFKLINDLKDNHNKTTVDALWKKYMQLPDKQTMQKNSGEPLVESKKQLIEVLEGLERDNLVMYAVEDGSVILL